MVKQYELSSIHCIYILLSSYPLSENVCIAEYFQVN